MSLDEVEERLADRSAWFDDDVDDKLATRWLARQPASTVQAMARAVAATTGDPAYERAVRAVFGSVPVALVAGERSRDAWDVPQWALDAARLVVIPGAGHLMMVEQPRLFGEAIDSLVSSL